MKRTPLKRKPWKSEKMITLHRAPMRRQPPSKEEQAFRTWVVATVRERDSGRCRRCRQPGTDAAHVVSLGMGANRHNRSDWRNWPQAQVMLCRLCHQLHDQGMNPWSWSEAGVDEKRCEAEARAACAAREES